MVEDCVYNLSQEEYKKLLDVCIDINRNLKAFLEEADFSLKKNVMDLNKLATESYFVMYYHDLINIL